MRLEVLVLPVSDVDRAKRFYEKLGFRLDVDYAAPDGSYRILQFTPPGSGASIIFGKGVTSAQPGSIDRLLLAVNDIQAARAELVSKGVEVEVFHDEKRRSRAWSSREGTGEAGSRLAGMVCRAHDAHAGRRRLSSNRTFSVTRSAK